MSTLKNTVREWPKCETPPTEADRLGDKDEAPVEILSLDSPLLPSLRVNFGFHWDVGDKVTRTSTVMEESGLLVISLLFGGKSGLTQINGLRLWPPWRLRTGGSRLGGPGGFPRHGWSVASIGKASVHSPVFETKPAIVPSADGISWKTSWSLV